MSSTSSRPPDRAPTMADVAAAAGVSRALVSIVMRDVPGASGDTRRRVREVAEQLGYRPHAAAQVLRRAHSGNLGVLFSPRYPFEVEIVEAVYPAALEHGFNVVVSAMSPGRDLDHAVEELLQYRCEALVIVGLDRDDEWFTNLVGRVPVVRIGRPDSAAGVDVVRTDEARGVHAAIDHLVSLGHRDIAFVGGGQMPGAVQREAAYVDAMRTHDLAGRVRVLGGDYTDEAGAAAARTLLEGHLPTAVLAANDWSALGLLTEFERRGVRVPADVSVVGFDNSELAQRSYVSLTSVGQDPAALAREAVAAAHRRRTAGADAPTTVCVLPPELVVRTSSAPPRPSSRT